MISVFEDWILSLKYGLVPNPPTRNTAWLMSIYLINYRPCLGVTDLYSWITTSAFPESFDLRVPNLITDESFNPLNYRIKHIEHEFSVSTGQ